MDATQDAQIVVIDTKATICLDRRSDCMLRVKETRKIVHDPATNTTRKHVRSTYIRVRRDVVSAASSYFKTIMTDTRWPSLGQNVMDLTDISASVLIVLLCGIYGCFGDWRKCRPFFSDYVEDSDRVIFHYCVQNPIMAPAIMSTMNMEPELAIQVLGKAREFDLDLDMFKLWFCAYLKTTDLDDNTSPDAWGSLLSTAYFFHFPAESVEFSKMIENFIKYHRGEIITVSPVEWNYFNPPSHIIAKMEQTRVAVVGPMIRHFREPFDPRRTLSHIAPELGDMLYTQLGINEFCDLDHLSVHDIQRAIAIADALTGGEMDDPKKRAISCWTIRLASGWHEHTRTIRVPTICWRCFETSLDIMSVATYNGSVDEWDAAEHFYQLFECAVKHSPDVWYASFAGPKRLKDALWKELLRLHPSHGDGWYEYSHKVLYPDDPMYADEVDVPEETDFDLGPLLNNELPYDEGKYSDKGGGTADPHHETGWGDYYHRPIGETEYERGFKDGHAQGHEEGLAAGRAETTGKDDEEGS